LSNKKYYPVIFYAIFVDEKTTMITLTKKIILLGLFLFSLQACTIEKVDFRRIENIELQHIKGKKVRISCSLVFHNPNKQTLKIRPSSFDFYINDRQLGVAKLEKKAKLIKLTESSVLVPVSIELLDGTLPILLAATLKKTVSIRLVGKVKGSIFIFGSKQSIDVSKEISLKELKLDNLPFLNK